MIRVVFDTSLMVAAARSRAGASYALVRMIPSPRFQICLSVALFLEWKAVLTRPENLPAGQTRDEVLRALNALASATHRQRIHYAWRPFLRDPDDDFVFELALAARCHFIVTHNVRDSEGTRDFGVAAIRPAAFLQGIKNLP